MNLWKLISKVFKTVANRGRSNGALAMHHDIKAAIPTPKITCNQIYSNKVYSQFVP